MPKINYKKIITIIVALVLFFLLAYGPAAQKFSLVKSDNYFVLTLSDSSAALENITGWKLIDSSGASATIPPATKLFGIGQVNFTEDVFLAPNQKALIAAGQSPVGVSFLTNSCSYILGKFQKFNPPFTAPLNTAADDFYNLCVARHHADQDFARPEWRLFLNSDDFLAREHGILRLVDTTGHLQALLVY